MDGSAGGYALFILGLVLYCWMVLYWVFILCCTYYDGVGFSSYVLWSLLSSYYYFLGLGLLFLSFAMWFCKAVLRLGVSCSRALVVTTNDFGCFFFPPLINRVLFFVGFSCL